MSEQIEVLNKLKYLVGEERIIAVSGSIPALTTFSVEAVSFLGALSRELLSVKSIRQHQDVMSYAYWIRKASLEHEKQNIADVGIRIGRGMAFHIAPSNVPVNFAVSMTSSLLAGNITVIRVSNKEFEEVDIICEAINKLLERPEHEAVKDHICIVRYDHSDEITEYLSSICDVRVIWGGDNTIREIRRFPVPSRAIEMFFADRYSMAVADAKKYYELVKDDTDRKENAEKIAKKFYTDTYYSDQNACSSPRIVVWIAKDITPAGLKECKDIFWASLQKEADERYDMKPVQAVDKLSNFTELAMKLGGAELTDKKNNKLYVININKVDRNVMDYKTGGGFFFQYDAGSIEEIVPFLGKQCQTVAVLGIEKKDVVRLVRDHGVRGVDRVVDFGDTMGLEFVWDGYKMIESMSRVVYVFER
ncbi:MAG: hypothetical protein IKQ40_03575 [Lachnospiraceae bacterium]|nr:hypothetical protein [Lachnospiraceae bacterium]